ncbi:hypothetical protein CUT44_14290 [Streptomyces carminius]|uniref:Uncharacterized protein n=1 Tax=Streptomyces carminius TaxID=2665496 RepID=A0A2M8LYU1_9ACTN|nr:hypothetical protein [Streptomyces carminius]PJE97146.1 hypothetical protein CUT44_14290 [Streptomyces carminius]
MPHNHQPAPSLPHSEDRATAEARRLIEAVENVYRPDSVVPTSYRDPNPVPVVGAAPPVPQPGRPPMSQRATDVSGIMLAAGVTSLPISGGISLVMWTVGQVNPAVVGIICLAPVAFLGALSRVFKQAKEVAAATPPVIHQHYAGDVHQDNSSHRTKNTGLIAQTKNDNRRR